MFEFIYELNFEEPEDHSKDFEILPERNSETEVKATSDRLNPAEVAMEISKQQQHFVNENTCEKDWQRLGDMQELTVSKDEKVYFVPCSHWAVNTTYIAYFEKNKKLNALTFEHQTPLKESYSTIQIHNLIIQDGILYTSFYISARGKCASKAIYVWQPHKQSFKLDQIYIKYC